MSKSKWYGIVAASLVAGLVLGTLGSAAAASSKAAPVSGAAATPATCGLGIGRSMRDAGGRLIDVVASLTGKSESAVQAERVAGKTFSQIAAESDVTRDQVVSKALTTRTTALDAAVKAGTVTQAQADLALARMKTQLTTRVDATGTTCGNGAGTGRGSSGGGARRGTVGCGGACQSGSAQ